MIGSKFDTKSKNIDALMDMMISAQKENGVIPTMTEALFDPVTKERINMFKRKRLEENGVDLKPYGLSGCNKCTKCKDEKPISNIERGIFVYNEDDLVDEEDGDYICEFCTKIGYSGKYRPDVCDVCDDCEGCTDFAGGACDGCGYSSMYNGGVSYGQASNEDVELKNEDKELIDEVLDGGPDYEVMKPVGGFTIMNY